MNSTVDLCAIPAGVSPNGVYNFVDPPSLGPAVLGVGISLAVISTAFVIGRLCAYKKKARASDHFTWIGCLFNIAYTGVILAQHRYYRHSWDTPVCWYDGRYLRLPFVQTMLFAPVFFFPKTAIFLLYRQLFASGRRLQIMIDVGIAITLLLYLSEIPLAALYAAPRAGQSWDELLYTLRDNSKEFALGGSIQSAISTVLDLYIFFLPLPILFKLRMPASRKWQLIGVFSTALLGVAASVVSLVFKLKILTSKDSNWLAAITSMASLVETNIALIVGCMPACAHLAKIYIGESAFYKSIKSRLLSISGGGTATNENAPQVHVATIGSDQSPRRKQYYELTDTQLLETQTGTQNETWDMDNKSRSDSTASAPEHICNGLIAALGVQNVLLPGSSGYNASLFSYYTPQAAAVHPLCFVTPQTAADVSTVVATLTQRPSCSFAVRSGGHMWFPNASSEPGGVTIDLRALHSISLSPNSASVSVGVGATWDAVYKLLEPAGLSVAGGRVAGVGVGGLTLGGGLSFFSPRQGWTCNQAVSFQVVLANGTVVTASRDRNSDLWWGLRGGSNNFGIVTKIELVTFRQGPLWSVMTFNPVSVVDKQAKIYSKIAAAENYDENASFLTGWGYSAAAGLTVALNQLVYTRPTGGVSPPVYRDILTFPTVFNATPVVANMSTIAIEAVANTPPQAARYLTVTTTFAPTEAMILAAYQAFNASLPLVQNITNVTWAFNIEPLPPQIYARGGADNALGLANRRGTLAIGLLSPSWQDPSQDEQMYAAARTLLADVEKRAKKLGVYDPYIYLNYAAPWQKVIASYGSASVSRLQRLRMAVDPRKVFTRQVPGGFKVPY
ncbi:hypothetical protein QBC43DRAFT_379012 [Cladorrhinum sp. PSN259]|nr:hypothetical protein QBC43DRAFT_379012 [Cladorrhinum sp. PSN259]